MIPSGHIDLVSRDLIEGWLHLGLPGPTPTLEIHHGEDLIGTCQPDQPRPDLAAAGLGDCAFSFLVPLHRIVKNPDKIRLRLAGTPLHLLPDAETRVG